MVQPLTHLVDWLELVGTPATVLAQEVDEQAPVFLRGHVHVGLVDALQQRQFENMKMVVAS